MEEAKLVIKNKEVIRLKTLLDETLSLRHHYLDAGLSNLEKAFFDQEDDMFVL